MRGEKESNSESRGNQSKADWFLRATSRCHSSQAQPWSKKSVALIFNSEMTLETGLDAREI